jgi:NAD-dependent SIR2 family protein deacetylase
VTEQPVRHTVDTITSDALDQLYADRDEARAAADRYLTNGTKAVERLHWRAHNAEQRAEQAEAAITRVRAAHLETADGRCSDCLVRWPCPDICRLDGPPGCKNCDEYHSRPA